MIDSAALVWLGSGLVVGGLVAWLVASRRLVGAAAALTQATERVGALEVERADGAARAEALRAESVGLREEKAALLADLANERRGAAEKLELLQQAEQRLREAFDALSAQALARNNQAFLDLAQTHLGQFQQHATTDLAARQQAIDGLVAPLRESVTAVHQKLEAIEKERHGAYSALASTLQQVAAAEQQLRDETARLGRALRSPSVRGRWGEIQLQRVVELAGMLEHCDFFAQESVTTDDGRLRPDLVVRLPGGKNVVVDAKAPLAAYLEALESPDDAAREARLRDHARQVRDHMKALGAKAYQAQFTPAPEFVVMFLPGETFFAAALQHDPALIEFGVDQRVIPASPTTLIALLRAVAYGWRQEALAENARRICEEGKVLYERIGTMAAHFQRLGTALRRTVQAHDDTVGTLERRILPAARRLRDLEVSSADVLPELDPLDLTPRALQAPELVVDAGTEPVEAEKDVA